MENNVNEDIDFEVENTLKGLTSQELVNEWFLGNFDWRFQQGVDEPYAMLSLIPWDEVHSKPLKIDGVIPVCQWKFYRPTYADPGSTLQRNFEVFTDMAVRYLKKVPFEILTEQAFDGPVKCKWWVNSLVLDDYNNDERF